MQSVASGFWLNSSSKLVLIDLSLSVKNGIRLIPKMEDSLKDS